MERGRGCKPRGSWGLDFVVQWMFFVEVDEHPQTNDRDPVPPPPQLPPHPKPPSPPHTRDPLPSTGTPKSHDLGFVLGGKRRERVWLGSWEDRDR
ncbi:hypothetical protein ACFX2I_047272 [Malus domestica]